MVKKLKAITNRFKAEVKIYQCALSDTRTPKMAKSLLKFVVAYALSPIDIIPDFIPIIGHLDDAIIIPTLIVIAIRMVPKQVMADSRSRCA